MIPNGDGSAAHVIVESSATEAKAVKTMLQGVARSASSKDSHPVVRVIDEWNRSQEESSKAEEDKCVLSFGASVGNRVMELREKTKSAMSALNKAGKV